MREALVRTRTKYISLARASPRREGLRIRSGGAPTFAKRVEELSLPAHLSLEVAPLLVMLEQLTVQIRAADKRLAKLVDNDEAVARLCTVPGIGPVTAVTFVAVVSTGWLASRARPRFARISASYRVSTARGSGG